MKRLWLGVLWTSVAFSGCSAPDGDLPADYRRIPIPASVGSVASRQAGRELFLQHCVLCHGERGDGHGTRVQALSTAPRDFTDAAWRERTSPRRLFFAIREGARGTAMPAWRSLGDDEIWNLVSFVQSVGEGPK
jgi:high-affinity iron transporter